MYGRPTNLCLTVAANSPIKTVADLKAKHIGSPPPAAHRLATRELSRQQGWGSDGIKIEALGSVPARLAAMTRGELDGLVIESATGFELEEQGKGRNILFFGDIAKHFYTHVIFATDSMIEKRPDTLKRFLRGWFKTIAFMRREQGFHRQVGGKDRRRAGKRRVQDLRHPDRSFFERRRWDPAAIDVIRNSLKELAFSTRCRRGGRSTTTNSCR